jgi:hypothetical protein
MIDATISQYRIVGKPLRTPFGVTSGDGLSCGRKTWADLMETDIYTFSIAKKTIRATCLMASRALARAALIGLALITLCLPDAEAVVPR